MRLFRRKPKFTHPCPVCEHAGQVYPHRGQHAVAYPPSVPRLLAPPAPPPPPDNRMTCGYPYAAHATAHPAGHDAGEAGDLMDALTAAKLDAMNCSGEGCDHAHGPLYFGAPPASAGVRPGMAATACTAAPSAGRS